MFLYIYQTIYGVNMAIDKLNLFAQTSGMQAIAPTKAVGGQPSAEVAGGASSDNPFSKEGTVGINTNIGIGDTMSIAPQAGKKAGIGKTLAYA